MVQILRALKYDLEEFLLTPQQFGIPNSRLRYYLLASLQPRNSDGMLTEDSTLLEDSGQIRRSIPSREKQVADPSEHSELDNSIQTTPIPISLYLDEPSESTTNTHPFAIPRHVLAKWGRLLDIVKPTDRRSCCFTRSKSLILHSSANFTNQFIPLGYTVRVGLMAVRS